MHVKVQGKDVEIKNSLRKYIDKKMTERIKVMSDKIIDAHIHIEKVKNEYTSEIIVMIEGKSFRCAKKAESLSESIDLMVDALEKKLRRVKEVMKNHHTASVKDMDALIDEEQHKDDDVEHFHIDVKSIDPKPMDNTEALLQFQESKKPYFAFWEIENNEDMMNVQISKYPVFLFKPHPGHNEFDRFAYKRTSDNVFSRVFGGEGWYEKKVTVDKSGMTIVDRKKVKLREFNVTQAAKVLFDSKEEDHLVYINSITGRAESIYKEHGDKFTVLRYGE